MARIGHADRLPSGLPSGALHYSDDVAAISGPSPPPFPIFRPRFSTGRNGKRASGRGNVAVVGFENLRKGFAIRIEQERVHPRIDRRGSTRI